MVELEDGEKTGMSDEGRRQDPQDRGTGFLKVEARPRNWAEPVILVMLRQWNSYGYELMERITEFGLEAMNPGTLYRALKQLEKKGAVKSTWETLEGGPARRVYSITDVGEAYLGFWVVALEQYQRNVDAFFRLYTGKAQRINEEEDG